MNLPDLRIHDLPDLYSWGGVPIITIEQAALLWGGIDPAFTCDTREAKRCHPEQYQAAMIAKQAFLGGIVMKTLEAYELYLCDFNNSYRADQRQESFTFEDIDTRRTIVQTNVLIEWAQRRNIETMRQKLTRKEAILATANFPCVKEMEREKLVIEHRPLEPRYPTPEFEAACEVVRERWNKQEEGVNPLNNWYYTNLSEKYLKKKQGVNPAKQKLGVWIRLPARHNLKTSNPQKNGYPLKPRI